VPEGRRCFGNLTVRENLFAAARPGEWTLTRSARCSRACRNATTRSARSLSGGEQQMLTIGRALMTNPKLLILDEATEGLAPVVRQEIWAAISRLKQQTGLAILVIDKSVALAASQVDGPIRLAGHSAGGQIVTRLVCGGTGLPDPVLARVERVMSISGVHDLRPLLRTQLNDTIGLDASEARAESPALLEPAIDVPVTCWVGANERSEFVRQSALLANAWRGLGLATDAIEEPDRHHFDVIDGLASPVSPMAKAIFS
jgi:hypothetical protein